MPGEVNAGRGDPPPFCFQRFSLSAFLPPFPSLSLSLSLSPSLPIPSHPHSLPPAYRLREFALADCDRVLALWRSCEGIGLNESDTREAIAAFLVRNPGLSLVATDESGVIVGAVLGGHDGRRGYLHHLAVAPAHRRRGLGRRLVDETLARLRRQGIQKCNIFLYAANATGRAFWMHEGWSAREDLVILQKVIRAG
jgi:putative acetyltransferase